MMRLYIKPSSNTKRFLVLLLNPPYTLASGAERKRSCLFTKGANRGANAISPGCKAARKKKKLKGAQALGSMAIILWFL